MPTVTNQNTQSTTPLKPRYKVGALWGPKQDRNGRDYFSGEVVIKDRRVKFIAFPSNPKFLDENPNRPSFEMYLSNPDEDVAFTGAKEAFKPNNQSNQNSKPAPRKNAAAQMAEDATDAPEDGNLF